MATFKYPPGYFDPPYYGEPELCTYCDEGDNVQLVDDVDWVCAQCLEDVVVAAHEDRLERDQIRAEDGRRDA